MTYKPHQILSPTILYQIIAKQWKSYTKSITMIYERLAVSEKSDIIVCNKKSSYQLSLVVETTGANEYDELTQTIRQVTQEATVASAECLSAYQPLLTNIGGKLLHAEIQGYGKLEEDD